MSAVERVAAAYAAIDAAARPEIWIALRPLAAALSDARAVDAAVAAGTPLPLAGMVAAVKNNIDVADIVTTAGCPTYSTSPAVADAPVVARLRAAGAVVIGATNLDQFATGLVGTRSPYGAVRDARRPDHISGGSSSGSAVAVALGLVDIALGTDTAGSGRVPAALQAIVGIKPTVGVVPTDGVVPACRSYDCVTVFARDLDTADAAMGVIAGGARPFPPDAPLAADANAQVAVPRDLPGLSQQWQQAFRSACARMAATGIELVEIDLNPFLDAARLLYDGGLVAERHDAVGAFVDAHRHDPALDPTVGAIIAAAGEVPATRLLRDRALLIGFTAAALAELDGCDALLIPTTTEHPRLTEVAADPVGVNARLGTYTNFCNLMDLCGVAVPAGTTCDGAQFGVTVVARAGADAVALDLARLVAVPPLSVAHPGAAAVPALSTPWPARAGLATTSLLVVGAHLRGQPLDWQLTERGARWCGPAATAPLYRLSRLETDPPKPGLARVGPDAGTTVNGELWLLSTAMLGDFLAALPAPMALGRVTLADGAEVIGFGCTIEAWQDGADISHHGDWPGYLRRTISGATVSRADVAGRVWRRQALAVPGEPIDTTTEVEWLQGDELFIDLRTDHTAPHRQQGFAGTLRLDGDEWTWVREFDLHPAEALPDRGRLHRAGDVLVETGIGRDYHEDWVATEPSGGTQLEMRLRDATGAPGMLLRVGDRFGYVRGRSPQVDLEISLGTVEADRWHITRSTLPSRVGDDLAPEFAGPHVAVADLTPDGTPARRRWFVAIDRPAPLLAR